MPRNSRTVRPDLAHHVTQRGVNRCNVFSSHKDRDVYLNLVKDNLADAGVRVLAYCLMTNHVHWLVIPGRADSLAVLFQRAHGRYAQYWNARVHRSGHLWQNRYFSCAVQSEREAQVLRYIESNPCRAALAASPEDYRWSSAAAHLAGPGTERIPVLDWKYWTYRGGATWWQHAVLLEEAVKDLAEIRRATYAGAPLGSPEFVAELEQEFSRVWRKPGRPARKSMATAVGATTTGRSGTVSVS